MPIPEKEAKKPVWIDPESGQIVTLNEFLAHKQALNLSLLSPAAETQLVVSRIRAEDEDDLQLVFLGEGAFSKSQIIDEVQRDTDIGKQVKDIIRRTIRLSIELGRRSADELSLSGESTFVPLRVALDRRRTLTAFLGEVVVNPDLRNAFRRDPIKAATEFGVYVSAEQRAILSSVSAQLCEAADNLDLKLSSQGFQPLSLSCVCRTLNCGVLY
jgi:hypothetical protein